jgi:hypothetical protein
MPQSTWYRRLGLGTLLLHLYHRPVSKARAVVRQGGPWAMRETERRRAEMEAAAATLPPLPVPQADSPYCLHVLTGQRFWYQTAFCLHSFTREIPEGVRVEIYDDGTLSPRYVELLSRLGPAITIHAQAGIIARLDDCLPEADFPVLRELWRAYPHIRKITDVHAGRSGFKLVIDSDLLFFRRPQVLLDWMSNPSRILHAVDCIESYGYSRPLMERLARAPIPELVNVGLCGMDSAALDWAELEAWCAALIERERRSYYLEQALVAMLAARQASCLVAPARDYVTMPSRAEVASPRAVMHHYVADSKRWYFRQGWRHAIARPQVGRTMSPDA